MQGLESETIPVAAPVGKCERRVDVNGNPAIARVHVLPALILAIASECKVAKNET